MVKPGDEFNKLVQIIERAINNDKNTKIYYKKYTKDKSTIKLREHDILIEHKIGHHAYKTSIECKNWKRRVGCKVIEELKTKFEETQIDRGIVVSSSGFTNVALDKAKKFNIECYTLIEAQDLDWCLCKGIAQYKQKPTYLYLSIVMPERCKKLSSKQYTLFEKANDGDKPLNNILVNKLCRQAFKQIAHKIPITDEGKRGQVVIKIDNSKDFYITNDVGEIIDGLQLNILAHYETEKEFIPLSYYNYKNVKTKTTISDVASAPIKLGQDTYHVLLNKNDENIVIKLVKETS